jgi:nanoRNase/pAp phosphatase (c-di-AMP/oligoRNAs hydrolase)
VQDKLKFVELLENRRGESHAVILPNYADPDAIASAYAHKLISADYGIKISIHYGGSLHPRHYHALVKLLDIDITPIEDLQDIEGIQAAVLIEDQMEVSEQVTALLEQAGIPVILCLQNENTTGIEGDLRELCKSCTNSTVYARYFEEGILKLEHSRKDHIVAATALLYGILSETDSFTHASEADFKAASYLSNFRDPELLEHIMSQTRSKQIMDIIRRALANREVIENYCIAGIGYLRAEDREAISQAADFLLTEENVHTAIVYGIMDANQYETLTGGIRTTKITLNPEEFITSIFGREFDEECENQFQKQLLEEDFNIPIGFLKGNPNEKFRELKWQVYEAQVKHKIYSKIGVKQDADG